MKPAEIEKRVHDIKRRAGLMHPGGYEISRPTKGGVRVVDGWAGRGYVAPSFSEPAASMLPPGGSRELARNVGIILRDLFDDAQERGLVPGTSKRPEPPIIGTKRNTNDDRRQQLRRAERELEDWHQQHLSRLRQLLRAGVATRATRREVAEAAAWVAAGKIGIAAPSVRLSAAPRGDAVGWVENRRTVCVLDGRCLCKTAATVAHETYHVKQLIEGETMSIEDLRRRSTSRLEAEAHRFQNDFRKGHFSKGCARCRLAAAERVAV